LAWVSERLAVSMRQAEDLILRDYIISAASEINAGGGSNNRKDWVFVVVKSLVMDLKLLARNGEDNKAQAEQYALAA
jgi:hypothetical protein